MSRLKEAELAVGKLRARAQQRREYHRLRVMWLRTTVTGELTKLRWKVEDIRGHVGGSRGERFTGLLDTLEHCLILAIEEEAQYGTGETGQGVREGSVSGAQEARPGSVESRARSGVGRGPSTGLDGDSSRKESFK